jgi:hypothetical protein
MKRIKVAMLGGYRRGFGVGNIPQDRFTITSVHFILTKVKAAYEITFLSPYLSLCLCIRLNFLVY